MKAKYVLSAVIVSALILVGMTSIYAFSSPEVNWKFGGVHAVGTPETKAEEKLAELVEEKSDGEFVINVFPGSQLGAAVPQLENLKMGAQQMFANVAGWNSNIVEDWNVVAMPFAFKNREHMKAFQETEAYEGMKQQMIDQAGIKVLADNWYRLPKALLAKKPVFDLDDLQGMKLRMPEIETYYKTWAGLGAKTTSVPWAEAYMALQSGTVRGMDSPLGSIYGQKFYEVAPYITMTRHLIAPVTVLVNNDAYQELSPEFQQILAESAEEAGEYYTDLLEASFEEEKQKMMAEGAAFIEVNVGPFAEKAMELAKEEFSGDLWQEGLLEDIEEVRP